MVSSSPVLGPAVRMKDDRLRPFAPQHERHLRCILDQICVHAAAMALSDDAPAVGDDDWNPRRPQIGDVANPDLVQRAGVPCRFTASTG